MSLDYLDLIPINKVHKKKIHFKNIFLALGILIIIITSIVLGINLSQKNKESNIEQSNLNENLQTENENTEENVTVAILEKPTIPMPVLSENAKNEMNNIYKSDTKRVFLTFDDGPSNTITPQILNILKQNNINATFFVLGSRVELYPDILKQSYNEGNFIANHGYSHKYSSIYASKESVINEYNQTESCIRNALGISEYSSHLFRFPGGLPGGKYSPIKHAAVELLEANGVAHVDWNSLSRDAEGKFTKEELINNVIQTAQGKNSVVVLMHDAGGKQTTADALQDVINYFRDNGYVFMTFYDILK